jgi:membrane associated rhomboid family serine protease
MFLHGDILHLAFNMWFLGVFGRAVEYALQPGRFLAYYILCGLAGGIAHVLADPHSIIPCVGASGAISGVMGSYLAIHPMRKVKLWLGILWGVIELPAIVVLGIWFLLQYAAAGATLESGVNSGTAYMAHVGGFVAGLLLIWGTIIYYSIKQARMTPPEDDETETPEVAREVDQTQARIEDAFRDWR